MALEFTVSDVIPASPLEVFDAWLDSESHEKMTGGGPARISTREGSDFTAWNGYVSGRTLQLQPGRRIVQSWRTTEFAESDPDSRIEVVLEADPGGARVTLRHSNVPDGHTSYRTGWQDCYFEPMKKYFKRGT